MSLGEGTEPHPPPSVAPAAVPPAAVPGTVPDGGACENCGAVLAGPFCHACGQAAEPPTRSVRAFANQAATDLTNLDGRIPRTLGLLLARPGRLTREYLAGRRVRYTQPLQVYLGCAAAFFFVNAYRPFLTFNPRTSAITSSLSAAGVSGNLDASTRASLAARGISLEQFRGQFEAATTGYLPAFLIGSVLLFAVAVQLAFRRERRGYLEHAVFALHWSAFFLLLMIVDRLLPQHPGGPGPADRVVALVAVVYLGLALKHVYAESWLATGIKTLLLFVVYQLLLSLWMLSAVAVAFEFLL
ncbi:MAG TPA: DUF3667 domain-containing protein [Longimicrobium sp.]|nr:DUF3667 domain-containing protein [Longimicrobium sp.]